jgi:hypothetical protein
VHVQRDAAGAGGRRGREPPQYDVAVDHPARDTPFVGAPATGTLAVLAVPAAVPTLEWWGLLLLFGLLGLAAWWGVHRGHVPPPASA